MPADEGCWVEYACRPRLDAAAGPRAQQRAAAAAAVVQVSDRIRIQSCGRKPPWPPRRPHDRPDPRAQIPGSLRHRPFGAVRAPARPRALPLHPPALQSLDAAGPVQRARLPVLGRARESVPGRRPVSRARPALRAVDDAPRGGAEPLRRRPHQGRARQQRRRLQFVLQARLEALLRQVVRRSAALGAGAVPAHRGAARDHSLGQGRDVRDPRARTRT